MKQSQPQLWIDTRLQPEEMNFLHQAISVTKQDKENNWNWNSQLAGNISKSEIIKDKDNWFYEKVLKNPTERMFYDDWNNYRKYDNIVGDESPPKFKLKPLWVNYQKQHEFNPVHNHGGLYSFVIFLKIPTHWKEQHALPISVNSNFPCASDFAFVWSDKDKELSVTTHNFALSPEDEGRMLFFPAWLQHMVYPFYECEEERVTISGNIVMVVKEKEKKQQREIETAYEEKKNMIEMMEEEVQQIKILEKEVQKMKIELELMKKGGENVGSN